jgi:hypothetical protein
VQVDPIKPTLKAPGIKLLKLKYDKPLSKFAFKINLRRYFMENTGDDHNFVTALLANFQAGAYTRPLFGST